MNSFLFALQFLTIIPVKIRQVNEKKISASMIYFPLIGLLLGLILVGVNKLLAYLGFLGFSTNIILVVSLIMLTGGLHLDGLADTADAFLSRKPKEEMLKIMRDSRIGVMGVLSIISIILLKISLLCSLDSSLKSAALVLVCVLSRWSLVFAIFFFPYARQEGKAGVFIKGINLKIFILATLITLGCTVLIAGAKSLSVFAIATLTTYIIGRIINNKIGGITGDTLGATNEIIEIITLFSICALQRSGLWII